MRKFGTLKRKEKRNDEKGIVNFFIKGVISVERLERKWKQLIDFRYYV